MSAAIVAMGFAAWTTGADWSKEIQYEPVIGLFGALCTWITLEFTSRDRKVAVVAPQSTLPAGLSPNDLRLSRILRGSFSTNTRRFLREHSFGQVFNASNLTPLENLYNDWKGVEYEHEHPDLKRLADIVIAKADNFLEKIATYSGPASRYPTGSLSVPTDNERATDVFEKHTTKNILELRELAHNLLGSLEEYERSLRTKAPTEFG